MGTEFRVFGPPGTGKTSYLSHQIERATEKHGAENIMVASFTKAAAAELNSRNLPIPHDNMGTLHALCHRVIGSLPIAEKNCESFNEQYPIYAISPDNGNQLEEMAADIHYKTDGDRFLAEYNLLRANRGSIWQLSSTCREFVQNWERWKGKNDFVDFTDMIYFVMLEKKPPPGEPRIGIYDEVQDFNRLQLDLIRHWSQFQDYIIMAGDDDQTLYTFTGATPDAFLNPPIPEEQKRVLRKSWRLPRKIQEYSQRWIIKIANRESKKFDPRSEEGEVKHIPFADYRTPHKAIELAEKYISNGKTVMFLTSCGYMLDPIKAVLKSEGLPYWNPYRRTRGDWNPMGSFMQSRKGSVSTRERILAFLAKGMEIDGRDYWNMADLLLWTDIIKIRGIMTSGAHERIETAVQMQGKIDFGIPEFYRSLFSDFALERALKRDVAWFQEVMLASKKGVSKYPLEIYKKRGIEVLKQKPRIIISTIHGVKGGESDCSPYDEPILTIKHGYIPIGDLNPDIHRLVSFNSDHHKIHRGGPRRLDGYKFTKASRPYIGSLLTITTPYSKTRITPNHYLTVRWAEDSLTKFAVYLMKRDSWWRIGVTKLHQTKHFTSGITVRLNKEHADGAWILGLYDTYKEALFQEQYLSAIYGVPDLTFEQNSRNQNQLSSMDLHKIWSVVDSETPAIRLLKDKGMSPEYPMWTERNYNEKRRRQTGIRNRWIIRASNLIPDAMEIPTDPGFGTEPLWSKFSVEVNHYEGMVYSLDVERWHHYISGGAVVHNCVFLFPDVSLAAMQEYEKGGEGRDSVIRTFYVGMTRAKESLLICNPVSGISVRLP